MKQIKYKAWIPDTKSMMSSGSLDFWFQVIAETGINPIRTKPNMVMLQFTGLLDKNGKEIHEGDLLNYGNETDGIFEVDMQELGFFKNVNEAAEGFDLIADRLLERPSSWEIIGNIYENPELLK